MKHENQLEMFSNHEICLKFFNFHVFADAKNRWEGPTVPNSHGVIRICAQMIRWGHTIKKTISCHSQRSFVQHVQHNMHELKNIGT